jgi:Holliday junction resolvase RusA-like endonuclease
MIGSDRFGTGSANRFGGSDGSAPYGGARTTEPRTDNRRLPSEPIAASVVAELRYTLAGPPVPWQRARSNPRTGARYTCPRMRAAMDAHRWTCVAALGRMPGQWSPTDATAVYALHVTAWCTPRQRGDVDNLSKLVADALQGIAYVNDRQIARVDARREVDGVHPRTVVVLRRIA